ncbi:MAG: MTH1187 family thiamine-binding protein [Candidatus Omnitrophota bacterium]
MLAIVSIFPLGKGESVGPYIAEALDEVDKSGLDYRLTAMGTIIEGDWDDVMKVVKKMRDRLRKKSDRVYLSMTIDDRADKRRRIEAKVKSVEEILGRSLRK